MTRVLHVLDHSLPMHSGYTFRTRAILKAQEAMGLEVRGVTGQRHTAPTAGDPEVVDGLMFHRTPGAAGGLPLVREWAEVSALADRIVELARTDRKSTRLNSSHTTVSRMPSSA